MKTCFNEYHVYNILQATAAVSP